MRELRAEDNTPLLTQADVARLLSDNSTDSRTDVLEKVAASYNGNKLGEREREVAEQIFRLLMRDVAQHVRETLAERIKANDAAPRDVVLHLAHDINSVSMPLLATSKVLSDADLISIVEASRDTEKLMAITKRPAVSQRVSDALVETHYASVVSSLVKNDGAAIAERTYEKIIDQFKGDAGINEALVRSRQLPVAIAERLISQVSNDLATELTEKYALVVSTIKQDALHVREDFMLRLLEGDLSASELEALVQQMGNENRLTPSLVMTALCRGQLDFFTVAIAYLSRISPANARRLIEDRGVYGFLGIFEKSGLPSSMYDAIRLLLRAVQDLQTDHAIPGSMLYANRLVERVVNAAGEQPIEHLPYFIALIRQNVHRT